MNERIRELEKQSVFYNEEEGIWELDHIKFAELILIEVTDILSTYRCKVVFQDGAEYNYEHPIIAIRKHFGVRE
jgi:hypothetical protein